LNGIEVAEDVMTQKRVLLLSLVAVAVIGIAGVVNLFARDDAARPAASAAVAKAIAAAPATGKTIAPAQKSGCDDEDDDDDKAEAKKVKGQKAEDNDNIEHECGKQDDDDREGPEHRTPATKK
jgi:hypothetical protein